jgi:nucleoside 2-deoxyribosyltransferase
MPSDWLDELAPAYRDEWDRFVEHVRRDTLVKMDGSAFVISLLPRGQVDIKFAVEFGMAIMLDKPIVAIAMPGSKVPARLRLVVDEIIEADLDTEDGREKIAAAIERLSKS